MSAETILVWIVIGGIAGNAGIGGTVDVDARTDGVAVGRRLARVTDMIVRQGDVIRARNGNPVTRCIADYEAVHHDVAFVGDGEAIAIIAAHRDAR